jgi:hypothetical protein
MPSPAGIAGRSTCAIRCFARTLTRSFAGSGLERIAAVADEDFAQTKAWSDALAFIAEPSPKWRPLINLRGLESLRLRI